MTTIKISTIVIALYGFNGFETRSLILKGDKKLFRNRVPSRIFEKAVRA
jgi:hypothetical protein